MSHTEEIARDSAMARQKEMIAAHNERLLNAHAAGKKVVSTFVPGNLSELLLAFDVVGAYPEITALQAGMRHQSDKYIREAERAGHAEDVCSYVKSDLGLTMLAGAGQETGAPPQADLLLLSFTGCQTFMKWFENVRRTTSSPIAMLHVPYQAEGVITDEMRKYVVDQLKTEIIPALERLTGKRYDEDKLKHHLARSAAAENDLTAVFHAAKSRPSPIDAYFGAVYYVAPIFTALRGTDDAVEYYASLRAEVEARQRAGLGPTTPDGPLEKERFRLVVEGTPCWTSFREIWRMFAAEGAVVVASTYSKVGGLYDLGFRHDPDKPLETLADYCLGCYTNLSIPSRLDLLQRYVKEYQADGLIVHSVKSCKAFGSGQVLLLRELEKRTGVPGCFLESDLVDSRYFSGAHFRNRLESYLQALHMRMEARA
jgi:benzoyl-CoA reductase subunit B